jgi:ferritin-like metal-binding protein YciE
MQESSETVRSLFVTGLRDAHALENQALALINRQLDRLESYPDLAARLRQHKAETDHQIERHEQILSSLAESHSAIKDTALSISGALAALAHTIAGDEILKNSFASFAFENFEAASYTGLITMAEVGAFSSALPPLRQTLQEELSMAEWLQGNLPSVTRRFIELKSAGLQASH